MKTYLVGGAVRDMIMGVKPKDRDWVIVGATQKDVDRMLREGYTWVGEDFPVLLHPTTKEEYALARVERKVGKGYHGFDCQTEGVTLEDDLMRRDLTMNAIAYNTYTKKFIDPFNGRNDIAEKRIKHVSNAFKEDPVRVLRCARFAARFGFSVSPDTIELMRGMVENGELHNLTRERVMQEMVKSAEQAAEPSKFLRILKLCYAMPVLFPEIPDINKEQNAYIDRLVANAADVDRMRMFTAGLLHKVPEDALVALQKRIVFPAKAYKFAHATARYSNDFAHIQSMSATAIVDLFLAVSITNRQEEFIYRMNDFLFARGDMTRNNETFMEHLFNAYVSVDIETALSNQVLKGPEIREFIRELRIKAVESHLGQ